MRRLSLLALVLPALVLPPPPSQAADARCDGRSATIVGSADSSLVRGTSGADVIVTNGARRIEAGRGNDRICITRGDAVVLAGSGNDVVRVVVATYRRTVTNLGSGRDTFRGGGRRDDVSGTDNARDVIHTGAGSDHVLAGGRSGMQDVVRTGGNSDHLELRSTRVVGDGHIDAGPGCCDTLERLTVRGDVVVIDARDGVATRDGITFLRFDGLEKYSFGFDQDALVTFMGSRRGEYAHLAHATISGDLGGGNDTVVGHLGPAGTEERLSGGSGADTLVTEGGVMLLDAEAGRATGGPEDGALVFDSFETLHGVGRTVHVTGSDAGESLIGFGCQVRIDGGGGGDSLRSYAGSSAVDDWGCAATISELYGDEGDDSMFGADRADTLIGGSGDDSADGGPGEDICEAERRQGCEG